MLLPFVLLILFCILGVLTGILTGLLPGLHVNNIALILLTISPAIITLLQPLEGAGITATFVLILIAVFIISVSISHTFHDTIPTTFLGAPDEDTALSVLPAHSLLLEGNGYEAVYISAMGSLGAIFTSLLILYPIRYLIGTPIRGYETLQGIMFYVLLCITILMIGTEKARIPEQSTKKYLPTINGMGFALFVFVLSGIFGIIILDMAVESPIGLNSPVLFPALSGLFGLPTLITSLATKPTIPKQLIKEPKLDKKTKKDSILSIITGSFAGLLVSIIPGITSATGTILAMNARGEANSRQTIITLSAVNTSCAFFVVAVLFILLRSRSGATLAVMDLIAIKEWSATLMPNNLIYFLIALLLGGTLSFFSTIYVGKLFAKFFHHIPYQKVILGTILLIIFLVFLFTGFIGVLILFVATFIGLLTVQWGVRRSHAMGVLLLPIMLYFFQM